MLNLPCRDEQDGGPVHQISELSFTSNGGLLKSKLLSVTLMNIASVAEAN
jgi:hypothetical protein